MTGRKPAQVSPELQTAQIQWSCSFTKMDGSSDLSGLTVGEKFKMNCSGPAIGEAWKEIPKFGYPTEEWEFTLVPLSLVKADASSVELIVTGYKPGEFTDAPLTLGEGANQVHTNPLSWKIQTVIAEQGPPPQPIPPFGPLILIYPWWLWVSIVGGIALIAALIFWRVRRHVARKKLIEKLMDRGAVLTPYQQLHKDFRQLMRTYQGRVKIDEAHKPQEYLTGLDNSLRVYISRTLLVPAQDWSNRAIIRDVKRRHRRIYKTTGEELRRLLEELRRAQGAKGLTFTDCEQLHEMGRKVTERIEASK